MKFTTFSFALVVALGAASGNVSAQQGPVLQLDTSGDQQGDCEFQTVNGVSISGTNPGEISASGSFVSGACGTGGSPSAASVQLSATPSVINEGETAQISWSGIGDVCRDNGSNLPATVAGWPDTGDACIGTHECATGDIINPTFQYGGTYTFKLKCTVGATAQQPRDTAVATATVEVNGTPPPSSSCTTAPEGFSRQLIGDFSLASGVSSSRRYDVDMTQFINVYGQNLTTGETGIPWPGVFNSDLRLTVGAHRYLSMAFTVPTDMPFGSATANYGGFSTNGTLGTNGVAWSISITEDCGDFSVPPPTDLDYFCYENYPLGSGLRMPWVVTPPGQELAGYCNLKRGHSYHVNIIPAPLSTGNPMQSDCPISQCVANFKHGGAF